MNYKSAVNGKKSSQNIQVAQLAILNEGDDKFIDRKLARIMEIHKGNDGNVRVIDHKT